MDEFDNLQKHITPDDAIFEDLDEFDVFLRELIPAVLGDQAKTDIRDLSEKDYNEVIMFLGGLLQQDYTG
jgi:hypothetical protein